jgi:hypothetical protein
MFKVMKRKMTGMHAVNTLRFGPVEGQPAPNRLRVKVMSHFIRRIGLTDEELDKWAKFMPFELGWWRDRGWLDTRSFADLSRRPVPEGFDTRQRLLRAEKKVAA